MSALHAACVKGNTQIVQHLLTGGAQTHFKEQSGKTPLHFAAMNNHSEILLLLLNAGANKDEVSNLINSL